MVERLNTVVKMQLIVLSKVCVAFSTEKTEKEGAMGNIATMRCKQVLSPAWRDQARRYRDAMFGVGL